MRIIRPGENFNRPQFGAKINPGHPLAQDLILNLDFNENGGKIYHDTSPFHYGDVVNSAGTPTWSNGQKGPQLNIASGQYISVPDNPSLRLAQPGTGTTCSGPSFSVQVIFRMTALTDGSGIIGKGSGGNVTPFEAFIYGSQLYWRVGNAGANNSAISATLSIGVWYNFIGTVISSDPSGGFLTHTKITQYINNAAPINLTAANTLTDAANPIYIGREGFYGNVFAGAIVLARVWKRALSPTEASDLIRNPYSLVYQKKLYVAKANSIVNLTEVVSDSINNWLDNVSTSGIPQINVIAGDTINYPFADSVLIGYATVNEVIGDTLDPLLLDAVTVGSLQPAFFFGNSFSITDTPQLNLALPQVFNDSYTITDSTVVQNLYVINLSFSDPNNFQDGITTQLNTVIYENLNDSYTIQDSFADVINLPIRFGDVIPPYYDYVIAKMNQGFTANLRDFFLVRDGSPFLNLSKRYNLNDAFLPIDGVNISLASSGNAFNDSFIPNDSILISLSIPLILILSDTLSLSDSISKQIPEPLNPYIRRYLNDVVM